MKGFTGKIIGVLWLASLLLTSASFGQGPAFIKEYSQSFPTYPFSDPSPIPLLSPVYPYFRYDGFTTTSVDKKWKVVALENDYLRLMILPEIGGKIWAAIEKKTGRPFLYYNHAVKFRDIAMRGPWTSGGLEANYGIIGHTPACSTPVDYLTRTNSDGSVSCIIGTLDLLTRSYWRMEIRLPADKALFTTRSCWYNTTPLEQPYYHWMNAGLKADDDLEFIYPGNKYLGHGGEYASWPVDQQNGKLISWYRNNDFGGYKSYHVFGKYTDFTGAYWHRAELGMVRYGTHDDKAGKKLWIWGLSRQGMIWEKLLTDKDGQYVELQSGRLFNQNAPQSTLTPFKHRNFAPYGTDTWEEYWYPVIGTHGFVTASEYGALNVSMDKGMLKIYLSPVQRLHDTIRVAVRGKVIYQRLLEARPLTLFADSIPLATPDSLVVTLGDGLLTYSTTADDSLARPTDAPVNFDWTTVYGYYLKACEAIDQKDYPAAALALDSALGKDANYLPALVKKAELLFRNMRYSEALQLAKQALSIHTADGSANFIYGLVNLQLGNYTDARDGFDIAGLDPAWRSAAYTSLARLYLRQHQLARALDCSSKALTAQPQNVDALQLQAVVFRLRRDTAQHAAVLHTLLSLDPLNHFARFERYLEDSSASGSYSSSLQQFTSLIRNELPQETFLELGCWYASCGATAEAIRLFHLSPPVAEARLWLSFLTGQPLDTTGLDPIRAFPFRSETGEVLEKLLPSYPSWFLRYQLALIYHDRNRIAETRQLLNVCGDQPAYAPFYAFRAAIRPNEDSSAIRHDLERAASLDPQWRYKKLLIEDLIAHNDPAQAGAIAGRFYIAHPENYIMSMLYAKTLLLDHQFAACDQLLSHLTIIPFEGATSGRELYREAKLMQAVQDIKKHGYKKALLRIGQAKEWPENLGVGEPYPEDEDLRLEDWMSYQCYTALHQNAAAKTALERIVSFKPRIDNTVANFIPANNILADWAKNALEGVKSSAGVIPATGQAGKDANSRILLALQD